MNKAAFFDRDGTIIKSVNYLSDTSQIEILPGIISFCSFLQQQGYMLFVVSNQSGVARGFFDEDFVKKTNEYLQDLFAQQGVFFESFFYCPHHPLEAVKPEYLKSCFCRKPNPGMLINAAGKFDIDLKQSLMFGDKIIDLQAGFSAGCRSFFIQPILNSFASGDKLEYEKFLNYL
jgi:D-glycero-D-manno-heptose 1,7-bisphosphate phosphatase